MGLVNLKRVNGDLTLKQLINEFNILVQELSHLLNFLDVQNIRANGIEAKNIKAGAVIAEKIDVDQLSAITADLGHITAGLIEAVEIYGSYIATAAEGVYPKVEISSENNMIQASVSAANYLRVTPSLFGSPAIYSNDGFTEGYVSTFSGFGNTYLISSSESITLRPGTGKSVNVPSWSQVYSTGDSQTLSSALSGLSSSISGLYSLYSSLESRVSALEST